MEAGVQHYPASQLTRIPTTDAGDGLAQASVGRKTEIISGIAIWGRSVRAAHPSVNIEERDDAAGETPDNPIILDNSRIREDIGWSPAHEIGSSTADFMRWRGEHDFPG